jgi:hypothetical protein
MTSKLPQEHLHDADCLAGNDLAVGWALVQLTVTVHAWALVFCRSLS